MGKNIKNSVKKYLIILIIFSRFICFDEFKRFEEILCQPDVLFKCAFHLFDTTGSGYITFGKYKVRAK